MTTQQDIRVEMVLKAPRERVWNALTTQEGWTSWFSRSVEGDFEVGQVLRLDFGEHGVCFARVVEREEPCAFAYRWHPGEDCVLDKYPESEMTTVRFTLDEHAEGTLLTMVESGFGAIPESRRSKCVELNTKGWNWELEELRAFVEDGIRNSKEHDTF